jgi:hypothetical protein
VGLGRNFLYLLAERIDEDGAGAAGAGREHAGGGEGRLGQAGAWCSPMDAQVTCL